MKQKPWKAYLFWILFTEAVGGLSGWLTREGNQLFQETAAQPPLSPPGWVFGVVWALLFGLMGFSAARIWLSAPSPEQKKSMNLLITKKVDGIILVGSKYICEKEEDNKYISTGSFIDHKYTDFHLGTYEERLFHHHDITEHSRFGWRRKKRINSAPLN